MHGLFLHLFAYGFVSMSIWGVRKWPKKSEEKQKYKLHKTLNPLGRKAFRGASFSATKHIKSKRYRCHWRKASGINRFRAFFAQKFTNESIDANHCFPLPGGIRTPFFRRLAYSEPCGALFEAVIFKKGTECQEVVNEPRTVFSGASHRSPP